MPIEPYIVTVPTNTHLACLGIQHSDTVGLLYGEVYILKYAAALATGPESPDGNSHAKTYGEKYDDDVYGHNSLE